MKNAITNVAAVAALTLAATSMAADRTPRLFMDVHNLGSVTAEAVAEAHQKDLAVQDEFGVNFVRYWVDEENGKVYCLAEADDAQAVSAAHAEAHGLIPDEVNEVTDGIEDAGTGEMKLFLDVHKVGAGKVTAADVAAAHEKDLAAEGRHGVHFINYWVDPRSGNIFCLSEAGSAEAVLETHREAHGLISDEIAEVTQGD
jgi:hypothetical protein